MKKLLVAATLAAGLSGAAQADIIYVDYQGKQERFKIEDLDTVNVCRFRVIVGQRFNVPANDLMLGPIRFFQYPEKSLQAAGISNATILKMWDSKANYQCR